MSGKRPWTTECYKNGDSWKERLTPGEQLPALLTNTNGRI